MSYSESRIDPTRILLRDAGGATVFDADTAKVAVLAQFVGTWTSAEHHSPTSGADSIHQLDHDIGAAPLGAQFLLGWIKLQDGTRQEFSGSVVLGEAWYRNLHEWFGSYPAYPRVTISRHTLTPMIIGGRIKLREEWWIHSGDAVSSPLYGWWSGLWLTSRAWDYDLRVCAFVGGS